MTKAGERMLASARKALAFAQGGPATGHIVHVPDAIDTKRIRKALGLTQAAFATRYGFELAALRDWEQGRRTPTGAARTLIMVIDRDPEAVAAVVKSDAARKPMKT